MAAMSGQLSTFVVGPSGFTAKMLPTALNMLKFLLKDE
jgi:hypothetical protein